ncbi:MAG: hypothetical protein N3J91_09280 [Verrucomicrobiae bacterium]|nr:hypothetical protein [Verrucomicrobiae bacterium]
MSRYNYYVARQEETRAEMRRCAILWRRFQREGDWMLAETYLQMAREWRTLANRYADIARAECNVKFNI